MCLRIYFFLFFFLSVSWAVAQNQSIFFLKNNGVEVKTRDSADFIRIISEPDSGTTLFNIKEYYVNGKIKFIGKATQFDKIVLEGPSVSFYPSGKRSQMGTYYRGNLVGDVYTYYPNGKIYRIINYNYFKARGLLIYNGCQIKTSNDSTGKNLVTEGNGYSITYDDEFKNIFEEGPIKNGVKNGIWKGKTLDSNQISYTESYRDDKLISGKSTDKNGKFYSYNIHYKSATQIHDDGSLFKALNLDSKQPISKNQGEVTFYIDKDGAVLDLKIIGKLDDVSKSDILTAVSRKWSPCLLCGVPIKAFMSFPIKCKEDH
ncbi:toxin-antitoxin system YwqK family antitoxin [Mucilaginibacter paludis]|uniref:MORN variant repeat-containing protein n=1 Tax=Mucilaginibacter paludis DSM 18603 TaxID=714943 RepID=H1Y025_9SPHI|nr:hypothetical protein [Mucilaginibacter paludis]EHQ27934.1 hypothetical protein Mucpa_3839 [Mucilaginibacter paludis DSM 18603]